jgi:hypothetical protein
MEEFKAENLYIQRGIQQIPRAVLLKNITGKDKLITLKEN